MGAEANCDNNHSRRFWGLLHFLDFDRLRHKKRMLNYKRITDENHGEGTKIMTFEQDNDSSDHELLPIIEANHQVENKTASKKSSGGAHLITLLYKKLKKKKDRKLKDSSSAAQLLRTISIHYLECDDYVLPDEDSNSSTAEHNSHETDSSVLASPSVLDRSAEIEQKIESIMKEEHRISMDGVLDKIPYGHKLTDADSPRSKFGSEGFVSTNSKLAQRSIRRSRSLSESLEKFSSLHETVAVREAHRLLQQSNSVKEQESKSAHAGFLRARSLSESLDRYSHLLDFISATEPQRLHQRSNSVNELGNKYARGRVLRSHSLSESFDRYHLLESISFREPKRFPQRMNSVKDQGKSHSLAESFNKYQLLESISVKESQGLIHRSESVNEKNDSLAHKRVIRSRSLSESFDRHFSLFEPFPVREPKRPLDGLTSISEEDSQDMKSQITGGDSNLSEVPALLLKRTDSSITDDDAKSDICASDEPNPVGNFMKTEENIETDAFLQHGLEFSFNVEQPELTNEHDQSKECAVSDDQNTDDSSSLSGIAVETKANKDASDDPQQPIPISLFHSNLEEDAISSMGYSELQGAELQSVWIHSDEQVSVVNPEIRLADSDSFHVKEDAELIFVRNILKKSGFDGGAEEFLAVWYSSCDPVDQLLFVEDPETMSYDSPDICLDHRLLFDLINDVLLEIYESTIANSVRLSRYNPRVRPVPMGDHLLDEVWVKICWYLSSQQDANHTIQHVEARDYAKDYGWMKLQWDVERVGSYLEGLILDVLVEEVVLDFVGL